MAEEAKAGAYELLDLTWDEITSKPGEPLTFVRHRQGEIVDLNEEDARRLLGAGSVAPEGELAARQADALQGQFLAALNALPDAARAQVTMSIADMLAASEEPTPVEQLHVHHPEAKGFENEGHPRYANAAHGEGDPEQDGAVGESDTQSVMDDGTRSAAATRRTRRASLEAEQPPSTDAVAAETPPKSPKVTEK